MSRVIAPEVTRTDPPYVAGEREMLESWLDFHRATLLWKCAGLTDEQLKQRACQPSTLSLLGLVRHMTEVEHSWFGRVVGEPGPWIYATEEWPDADFDDLDNADTAPYAAMTERPMNTRR